MQSIHVALEASMAGLRILATPDLPQRGGCRRSTLQKWQYGSCA